MRLRVAGEGTDTEADERDILQMPTIAGANSAHRFGISAAAIVVGERIRFAGDSAPCSIANSLCAMCRCSVEEHSEAAMLQLHHFVSAVERAAARDDTLCRVEQVGDEEEKRRKADQANRVLALKGRERRDCHRRNRKV